LRNGIVAALLAAKMAAKGILWATVLLMVLCSADDAVAGELPVETFFRDYAVSNVKISPDGKSLVQCPLSPLKYNRPF
jgi:hypothetical protein